MSEKSNAGNTVKDAAKHDSIDVSVIVPVYNVEEFLRQCLYSITRQGDITYEVLMIDDGSTDSSGQIADEYVSRYPNFRVFHIPNGGLGHARNYGVERARGKYIFFLDSDDVLVDGILERMFRAAEHNGTDVAVCNVARFNSQRRWKSDIQERAFLNFEPVTHITKNLLLIYDTISCNKLIRRSFFQEHGFKFPERILYEDIPVIIPMMILCNGVSMVAQPGYLWRVRDGNNKSITQQSSAMNNLRDRLSVLRMVDSFFAENVTDETLIRAKMKKYLEIDLKIFTNNCDKMPEEQAAEVFQLVNEYIDEAIDEDMFAELSVLDQQKYAFVRAGDVQGYIRLLEYQKEGYSDAPVTETEEGLVAELPEELFTVPARDVTKEFASLVRRVYVDKIITKDESFDVYGHIYIRRYNMAREGDQKIQVVMVNEENNFRVPLDVQPVKTEFLTNNFGTVTDKETGRQTCYNYDYTGFVATVDLKALSAAAVPAGIYTLVVYYKDRFFQGDIVLGGVDKAIKGKCQGNSLIVGDISAKVNFGILNQLRFRIETGKIIAEALTYENGVITCELNRPVLEVRAVDKQKTIQECFEMGLEQCGEKTYRMDFNKLDYNTEYHLDAHLAPADDPVPAAVGDEIGSWESILSREQEIRISSDDIGVVVFSSVRTGLPKIWVCKDAMVVTASAKDKGILTMDALLMGDAEKLGDIRKIQLYVEDKIANQDTVLDEAEPENTAEGLVCHFRVDFVNRKITKNFYAGTRPMCVRFFGEEGEIGKALLYCSVSMSHKYTVWGNRLQILCYQSMFGTVRMQLVQTWPDEESSAMKRKGLILEKYPEFRKEPIQEKMILFESMWGTKYSCNPQALYEYINKHHPEYKCVWAFTDERTPIKGRAVRVRRGSVEYYHYLATAKYFVNNVNMPDDFEKRPEQVGIQTMHGTPLKTLGLDAPEEFPKESDREKFIAKNANWDYFISQGKFVEDRAAAIYGVERTILKTGYPRTDRLFHSDEKRTAAIKSRLGIPLDKKVILYTPTWRVKNKFDMKLDLSMMQEKLGKDYVLLIRLHHLATDCVIPEDNEFIFNLTSYQYVEDLYLITDVLITDYSSVMFDFALLNKPMVFFSYDLKEYTEKLRGLYVDFTRESPGPMAYTTRQVIRAVRFTRLNDLRYRKKVESFKNKYLSYENGNSCEMIMREVFGEEKQ